MCGRYAATSSRDELAELYGAAAGNGPEVPPSWNVAPTRKVYGIVDDGKRAVQTLRWGLIPSWAKDPAIGAKLINARVETLAEKPAWRGAYRHRRAVVPADGYYEWQGKAGQKQPYYLHPADGELALAGLYEDWTDPEHGPVRTMAIVTTAATGPLGEIHDRAPLILPPDLVEAWLDPDLDTPEELTGLLRGLQVRGLRARPVSTAVNRVGNDGPELVEALPGKAEQVLDLDLTR